MADRSNPALHLYSFSYRHGMPRDEWGHGGGFVIDCRCLPNPGRLPPYQALSGHDADVVAYFQREPLVDRFLRSVWSLIDIAVSRYESRMFEHLTVAFGCTGGRHRSVYCAEVMRRNLAARGHDLTIRHLALESST